MNKGLVTAVREQSPARPPNVFALVRNAPEPLRPPHLRAGRMEVSRTDIGARRALPPWGRASRHQRCSGSAATEQDLCETVTATSKVNWATTLDCVKKSNRARRWSHPQTYSTPSPRRPHSCEDHMEDSRTVTVKKMETHRRTGKRWCEARAAPSTFVGEGAALC